MHSKRRHKICILGDLESFRNLKGFCVIFPKILGAIERFTKVRIFLIPLSITFLNPKKLGFLFLQLNVSNSPQKIVGALFVNKLRQLYLNGKIVSKFLAVLKLENYRQYLLLRTDNSQKTVVGCPWQKQLKEEKNLSQGRNCELGALMLEICC